MIERRYLGWRQIYFGLSASILLAPAVAMPFSDGVDWGAEDFAAAAGILLVTWMAVEMAIRVAPGRYWRRVGVAVAVFTAIATWAHLAVQLWQ